MNLHNNMSKYRNEQSWKEKAKAYATNGNEVTRTKMIKLLTEQNKTMQSQATRGIF